MALNTFSLVWNSDSPAVNWGVALYFLCYNEHVTTSERSAWHKAVLGEHQTRGQCQTFCISTETRLTPQVSLDPQGSSGSPVTPFATRKERTRYFSVFTAPDLICGAMRMFFEKQSLTADHFSVTLKVRMRRHGAKCALSSTVPA